MQVLPVVPPPSMGSTKLKVGLEMLREARQGEFDTSSATLTKILANIVGAPAEPKFRKLRSGNAKIAALLATKGVRAILLGAGFVEEGEFLTLPADAPVAAVQEAIDRIAQQAADRVSEEQQAKAAEMDKRKEEMDKENEKRKMMKMQIADDAAARQEPGWKAKAAGVKDGRSITGCSDIGIGASSG